MIGDRTQQPAEGAVPAGAAPVGIAHPYPADCADTPPLAFLCDRVNRIAAQALGTDMDHAAPIPTHPNPASVPWPDAIACPFRPHGMRGEWYVFEERYAPPGYARQQVYLSDRQIKFGEIIRPLGLREDWLAERFPMPGGNCLEWDIVAVVRWIRHHIAEAPNRRRDHARDYARRDDAQAALPDPAPAPQQEAPKIWGMRREPWSQPHGVADVRTLTVTRDDKGKRAVALTIFVPGMRDLISVGVKLPEQAAQELSDVLAGVVRARP
jgi:hypothetical protein